MGTSTGVWGVWGVGLIAKVRVAAPASPLLWSVAQCSLLVMPVLLPACASCLLLLNYCRS